MIETLRERIPNNSPGHVLECSDCGTVHMRGNFSWPLGTFNWIHDIATEDTSDTNSPERLNGYMHVF